MTQHWLITGVSSGLGKALALEVASRGHKVSGTLRKEADIKTFEALSPNHFRGYLADVRDFSALERAVNESSQRFGSIDVLVNNAGYGLVGAVEELSNEEVRDQMEVNFFGALRLTQLVLPGMRVRRKGHIFNISSIAGMNGSPGLGLYNASKFALEGMSEGLMLETRHLGLQVTIVEPGPFRTHWAGSGLVHAKINIPDYAEVTGLLRSRLAAVDQQQPGSPEKAAKLICDVALQKDAPLRLLLGKPAYQVIEAKIKRLTSEYAKWKEKGERTDFE
jgi:NAD(P)-dependent dehydrogenase (short-subunit alcohol dehydrogenase family)